MEETDSVNIMHCRNGREYSFPELPHFSVDGYCPETRTVYELFGCFYHGHTCQPFRDVTTLIRVYASGTLRKNDVASRADNAWGYLFKMQ